MFLYVSANSLMALVLLSFDDIVKSSFKSDISIFWFVNEEITCVITIIILHTSEVMMKIIKKRRHHSNFFVWSDDGLEIVLCHDVFSNQKLIHNLSPQYGHCIMLLSRALLHFGQSLYSLLIGRGYVINICVKY